MPEIALPSDHRASEGKIGIQMHAPLQLGKCLFRLQLLFQGITSPSTVTAMSPKQLLLLFYITVVTFAVCNFCEARCVSDN